MDLESAPDRASPLERSVSQQSAVSARSHRSTVRSSRPRKISQQSSSASSIAASDKSLTSFPSFSPDSPRAGPSFTLEPRAPDSAYPRLGAGASTSDDKDGHSAGSSALSTPAPTPVSRKSTTESASYAPPPPTTSLVDHLTESSPRPRSRFGLFEDVPLAKQKIPGALHLADDHHIERLIARHGAVGLVRQIAEDLAQRDVHVAQLRRRADDRERALRKIIRECGLSNMDLETRLRSVEREMRSADQAKAADDGLSDLMNDAMEDTVSYFRNTFGDASGVNNGTIRASGAPTAPPAPSKNTTRGWKDLLWGGTAKRSSATSSANSEPTRVAATVVRGPPNGDRRPMLSDNFFSPPDTASVRSSSRASSIASGPPNSTSSRKPSTSFTSLALRLVAGSTTSPGDGPRGRAYSDNVEPNTPPPRAPSVSSARTAPTAGRAVSTASGPRKLMAMRRATTQGPHGLGLTTTAPPSTAASRLLATQERWDTMATSPQGEGGPRPENYGPVEMDTILPPDAQPPTLTHIHTKYGGSEYLTDRFGFIYDQRRKKRQRAAAAQKTMRIAKRGDRAEMLTNSPPGLSAAHGRYDGAESANMEGSEDRETLRSVSPTSLEEAGEEGKPKRWQDYLKIATFPTELLSHTPSISAPSIEVLEASEAPTKSSKTITSDQRGFVPAASTTAAVDSEAQPNTESDGSREATIRVSASVVSLVKEDAEPVKLLLQQLGDLHDSLQRDRTVRWNDFLRKVRAERRREGEAAAAAAAAAAEARFERLPVMLPEAKLADGEMIGISGLGNKGKVGRAKWAEFKNLVLGGIPVAYRAKVWAECSGASALRIPGYYEDLIQQTSSTDDDEVVVSQIQMDIHRTLTDNIFFRKGPGVSKLNEVLLAYARRNRDVGYCQGMNLIAANLLLMMPSAEDAFWILASIVESILPAGYYDHSLRSSRADQQVLRQYVGEVVPRLSQHLDALSIELEALTFQWFLSVFTDCLSAEALFRVWDVVLCTNDGSTFLFQVALALLKLNEAALLACETPAAVYTYISHQMTNHAISIDGLIHASEGLRKVVRREEVEARRAKAIAREEETKRERDLARERIAVKKRGAGSEVGDGSGAGTPSGEESSGTRTAGQTA